MGWQVIQPPCETLTPRDPEVQKSWRTLDETPTFMRYMDPQIPDRRQVVLMGLLVQGELPGLRQDAQ